MKKRCEYCNPWPIWRTELSLITVFILSLIAENTADFFLAIQKGKNIEIHPVLMKKPTGYLAIKIEKGKAHLMFSREQILEASFLV